MDYEKKYKEALELARVAAFNGHQSLMEGIFPELAESEDEMVRKEIIKLVKFYYGSSLALKHTVSKDEMVAWLEKQAKQKPFDYENADIQQKDFAPKETVKEAESNLTPLERKVKDILFSFHINAADGISFDGTMAIVHNLITLCQQEQKPADRIEPKFKVGDWIVNNVSKDVFLIKSTNNGYCTLEDIKGNIISPCLPPCESESHLWTIKDAKDGDVLCTPNGNTFIFKTIDGDKILDYCGLYFNKFFSDCGSPNGSSTHYDKCNYHPATKEQYDLLFQKMKESGYEWNSENKELKKISQRMISAEAKEAMYDKTASAWGEEDENVLEDIEEAIINYWHGDTQDILLDWLKSIKQRIGG